MLRRKVTIEETTSSEEPSPVVSYGSSVDSTLEFSNENKRRRIDACFIVRRVIFCGGSCIFCCFVFILMIVLTINEGHHFTCRVHGALCTPFREYIARFPMLPKRRNDHLYTSPRIPHSCERFESFLTHHEHQSRRLLFLLGESRGGSTYSYDTLNLHSEINMVGEEALFAFSNNVCNNNELLLRNHQNCTFDNWLEALYKNAYDRRLKSKYLIGTKINIEQIPPEFYQDLASYLACIRESAVILHVTRASTIASFLNYQAEVPERLYAQNFDFHSNQLAKGLEVPLELDPELAAEWVHSRDSLSQDLFRTLAFGAPLPLRYQRVYFEHLSDPVLGDHYWRSVFAFLGVDPNYSVQELRKSPNNQGGQRRTHNKTHGNTPCHQRIANWEQVKEALGPESLSNIACEGYSR